MNTRKIIKKIAPAGMAVIAVLFCAACQQEEVLLENPGDGNSILADAGRIHNEMIAYYYANRSGTGRFSGDHLSELLDLSWEYLDRQGHDLTDEEQTRRSIEARFHASYLKSQPDRSFSIDTATFIAQLKETGNYSPDFLENVDDLLVLAHENDDREVILEHVNQVFAQLEFGKKSDKAAQKLFTDIFNGSYEYWQSHDDNELKSVELKPSSWVIINDGIGGVLGSVFGPVGSIVVATAFSVATNEEVNN